MSSDLNLHVRKETLCVFWEMTHLKGAILRAHTGVGTVPDRPEWKTLKFMGHQTEYSEESCLSIREKIDLQLH
jgi:hypothetical protein